MKKLIPLAFLMAVGGLCGTLTIVSQAGVAFTPAAGAHTYPTDAVVRVAAKVSNSKVATVYADGESIRPEGGLFPVTVPVSGSVTVTATISKKPPEPFPVRDGLLSVKCNAASTWRRVVFGSPKDTYFSDDGASYLYPSTSDSAMAVADGGTIYVANTTNDAITVSTKGDDAVINCSPVKLSSGSCLVLGTKTSELWFKGAGNLIIMGATR